MTELELEQLAVLWGKFQHLAGSWSDATFPKSTDKSRIEHARDELAELQDNPADPLENADVILLMTHHAHIHGYNLFEAAFSKFEIIQKRKWGAPDERGVVHHIKL